MGLDGFSHVKNMNKLINWALSDRKEMENLPPPTPPLQITCIYLE